MENFCVILYFFFIFVYIIMSSISSNSSNSSSEGGNTKPPRKKQISPAKRWCFTLNNFTDEEISSIVPILKDKCSLGIIGKEVGEKGTPHLQGYVEFNKKMRPLSLGFKRIHWEKCKGNRQQNKEYCEKDGEIWQKWGFPREIQVITDDMLFNWQKEILEMVSIPCPMGDRDMYWYYGGYGIGKSQFLKYLCLKKKAIVLDGLTKAHILSVAAKNQQAEIFVFNLAKGERRLPWKAIELLKDGLFCDTFGAKHHGMVIMNSPHIIVMANEPPEQFGSFHSGKWKIKHLV
ncbi:MAG: putative viral replication protein [Cressdnaviricota sp.]|nr:MAG: putative viral replication protein [Cressdnaviricota sp.]